MKTGIKIFSTFLFPIIVLSCSSQKSNSFKPEIVYRSDDLIITRISEHSFEHTSFLQTQDFGNVPCNGLIVTDNNEAIVFDTPTNDKGSEELINRIEQTLGYKIIAVVPTHFHSDCLGGLKAFDDHNIPSYAFLKTIEFAKENNFVIPKTGFEDSLTLRVGNENIIVKFFGEGHTKDNVVGYFPSENIMFGGCLIKELKASKGFLGDANVADWSSTVERVKKEYPDVKIVIPGHGEYGNKSLLDYTIDLFKTK
jgi:metallo-beta-lactamase class B